MSPNLLELSCQDMFFAHWPTETEALRPHVPQSLAINTHDGTAWVGLVAFRVESVRTQGSNMSIPGITPFLNLNVRTYVTRDSEPGIYFLSSDLDSSVATAIGHRLFGFAVYQAKMRQQSRNRTIDFRSERVDSNGRREGFQVEYEPVGDTFEAKSGSVEEFLIEQSRYYIGGESDQNSSRLPTEASNRSVRTAEISRPTHQLQQVDADIRLNTLLENFEDGFLSDDPIVSYCERWDAGWNPLQSAFG